MTIESKERNEESIKPVEGREVTHGFLYSTINLIDLAGSESANVHSKDNPSLNRLPSKKESSANASTRKNEMGFINKV